MRDRLEVVGIQRARLLQIRQCTLRILLVQLELAEQPGEAGLARRHLRRLAGETLRAGDLALVGGGHGLVVLRIGGRVLKQVRDAGAVAIGTEIATRPAYLGHRALVRRYAFGRWRVARKQTAQLVRIVALRLADEQLLERHRRLRVIARRLHILHPVAVGLQLVVAAELRRYELRAQHAPLAHLLRAVARRRMDDLVAEHGGELGFVLELDQQSAVDRELAAGRRPGVQIAAVDDDELVWELPVRDGGQAIAYLLDVTGDTRIGNVVSALRLPRRRVLLLADLDFLRLGDEVQFTLAGHRVGRAPAEREQRGQEPNISAHGRLLRDDSSL